MNELQRKLFDLMTEIDTCLNFIQSNPLDAQVYIDRAKQCVSDHLATQIDLMNLQMEDTQRQIKAVKI